jgi:hypothetical protein
LFTASFSLFAMSHTFSDPVRTAPTENFPAFPGASTRTKENHTAIQLCTAAAMAHKPAADFDQLRV